MGSQGRVTGEEHIILDCTCTALETGQDGYNKNDLICSLIMTINSVNSRLFITGH